MDAVRREGDTDGRREGRTRGGNGNCEMMFTCASFP